MIVKADDIFNTITSEDEYSDITLKDSDFNITVPESVEKNIPTYIGGILQVLVHAPSSNWEHAFDINLTAVDTIALYEANKDYDDFAHLLPEEPTESEIEAVRKYEVLEDFRGIIESCIIYTVKELSGEHLRSGKVTVE